MFLIAAPTKPPKNASVLNLFSNSELKVYWTKPEQDGINGVLQGYKLRYKIKSTSEREVQEANDIEMNFPDSDHVEYTLTNLVPYTVYEIKIAAWTSGGLGPFAIIYGGIYVSFNPSSGDSRLLIEQSYKLCSLINKIFYFRNLSMSKNYQHQLLVPHTVLEQDKRRKSPGNFLSHHT